MKEINKRGGRPKKFGSLVCGGKEEKPKKRKDVSGITLQFLLTNNNMCTGAWPYPSSLITLFSSNHFYSKLLIMAVEIEEPINIMERAETQQQERCSIG